MSDAEQLRAWARLGAEKRLNDLRAEIDQVLRLFPELGRPAQRRGRPPAQTAEAGTESAGTRKRRGRRKMSAEQRAEVSERMRRYWAGRRGESGKGETGEPAAALRSARGRKGARKGRKARKARKAAAAAR